MRARRSADPLGSAVAAAVEALRPIAGEAPVGQVRARRPQFDARFARRSGAGRARPSASVASASSMPMRGNTRWVLCGHTLNMGGT